MSDLRLIAIAALVWLLITVGGILAIAALASGLGWPVWLAVIFALFWGWIIAIPVSGILLSLVAGK